MSWDALARMRHARRHRGTPERHRGRITRRRTWSPTRHDEVFTVGWRWFCSCLATGTAYTRESALAEYWAHIAWVRRYKPRRAS